MSEKNEIVYGEGFVKDVRKLPSEVQEKLARMISLLARDISDGRLHVKALSIPLVGKYSFRITRDWRVGFKFVAPRTVMLLVADRRDKIYKRLERL